MSVADAAADTVDVEAIANTEQRTIRALSEALAVVEREPGLFRVYSEDGTERTVDADTGACTCADAEYNLDDGEKCKHARRVDFATGARPIPEWVNREAVDSFLARDLGFYEEVRR